MACYSPEQQMTMSSDDMRGELDADDRIKKNTRDIAKKMPSTIKTNTLCHQWLSRRYKRGAFDIGRTMMEQFSASLPH